MKTEEEKTNLFLPSRPADQVLTVGSGGFEGNRFCTRGPVPALLSRGVDASEGGVQALLDKLTDQTALRHF